MRSCKESRHFGWILGIGAQKLSLVDEFGAGYGDARIKVHGKRRPTNRKKPWVKIAGSEGYSIDPIRTSDAPVHVSCG